MFSCFKLWIGTGNFFLGKTGSGHTINGMWIDCISFFCPEKFLSQVCHRILTPNAIYWICAFENSNAEPGWTGEIQRFFDSCSVVVWYFVVSCVKENIPYSISFLLFFVLFILVDIHALFAIFLLYHSLFSEYYVEHFTTPIENYLLARIARNC